MMENKPTTLESVVRSPRFYGISKYIDGWMVSIVVDPSVGMVSNLDGPTIDDAIGSAFLRIAALDAAERKEPPPSPEERLRRIHERWGETLKALDDDDKEKL